MADTNFVVGKSPTYGGKKKDVGNVPHWVGGGNSYTGPAAGGSFRNQKLQSKPRGSDKKSKSKLAGNTGNGTFRKNDHQVLPMNIQPDTFLNQDFLHR